MIFEKSLNVIVTFSFLMNYSHLLLCYSDIIVVILDDFQNGDVYDVALLSITACGTGEHWSEKEKRNGREGVRRRAVQCSSMSGGHIEGVGQSCPVQLLCLDFFVLRPYCCIFFSFFGFFQG